MVTETNRAYTDSGVDELGHIQRNSALSTDALTGLRREPVVVEEVAYTETSFS